MRHRPFLTAVALAAPLLAACGEAGGYNIEKASNEGGSAFYEIFVGSFCDSNGDGIGDLNGIASKLDYLEDLGVSKLWLTPIHPSNSYHKYDVKDYYAIDASFGTLEDFDALVTSAKAHHIGIIMDMVFNHASRRGKWFQSFVSDVTTGNKTGTYYNDFCWSKTAKEGYHLFSETGGLYVESRFSTEMPEFNLDSPHVQAEQKAIETFWLSHGVKGFRYDAVTYYYYGDVVKNVAYMKQLRQDALALKSDVYQVGEAFVDDQSLLSSYASSGMNVFNFTTSEKSLTGAVGAVCASSGLSAFIKAIVSAQQDYSAVGSEPVIFVSNHDQDRWGSYYVNKPSALEKTKMIASCYLLTPGTPFMYYGEEIMLRGIRGSSDNSDFARRQPMLWGGDEASCNPPEGKSITNQVTVGVKDALNDGWSLLNHEKKVLSIRNKYNDFFRFGVYSALDLGNPWVGGFQITYNGSTKVLIHNSGSEVAALAYPSSGSLLEDINTSKTASSYQEGTLTLQPFSSVLIG